MSNTGDNNSGVLTMTFPSLVDTFGYGYASSQGAGTILNGTTISLFNGATSVGSLSYTATPDPSFREDLRESGAHSYSTGSR